jgi:hypothetical protein
MYVLCNVRAWNRLENNIKTVVVVYAGLYRLRTGSSGELL